MHVIRHAPCTDHADDAWPGLCAVGRHAGVTGFEVWLRTLQPGQQTPAWIHQGELAALVMAGSGKLLLNGAPQRFQAPCSVIVPAGEEFALVNNAAAPIELVIVFTRAPQPADSTNHHGDFR